MKRQPIDPKLKNARAAYRQLREAFFKFNNKVQYPHKKNMWVYPCDGSTYNMESLRERVIAAATLGYDVVLKATDERKLEVNYVLKRPEKPYELTMSDYSV